MLKLTMNLGCVDVLKDVLSLHTWEAARWIGQGSLTQETQQMWKQDMLQCSALKVMKWEEMRIGASSLTGLAIPSSIKRVIAVVVSKLGASIACCGIRSGLNGTMPVFVNAAFMFNSVNTRTCAFAYMAMKFIFKTIPPLRSNVSRSSFQALTNMCRVGWVANDQDVVFSGILQELEGIVGVVAINNEETSTTVLFHRSLPVKIFNPGSSKFTIDDHWGKICPIRTDCRQNCDVLSSPFTLLMLYIFPSPTNNIFTHADIQLNTSFISSKDKFLGETVFGHLYHVVHNDFRFLSMLLLSNTLATLPCSTKRAEEDEYNVYEVRRRFGVGDDQRSRQHREHRDSQSNLKYNKTIHISVLQHRSTNANTTTTTTTTDGPDSVRLPVLRLRGEETAEQRRRCEAEADEAALVAMRERLEQNRRRREEEEKQEAEERQRQEEEKQREEERRAEEERLQREAEERKEGAGKAKKKTKVGGSHQLPPPEQLRLLRLQRFSDASASRGPDDGDNDDSSEASPAPSGGDDESDEHTACARCHHLERDEFCVPQTRKNATACQPCHDNKVQCSWSGSVGAVPARTGPGRKPKCRKAKTPIRGTDNSLRLSNLEDNIQGLKETFSDLANTQQEILDMLRENRAESSRQAHTTDVPLRTIKATLNYLLEFFQVGEDNAPKETESEQDKKKKRKMEVNQVVSSDEEESSD
ncbi:hypothetical protein FB446DRAFT_708635 [Lentinula raphanica]|nr:hypothetical protein FB446DRAFT_708635 [Lentinula raphanica]